MPIDESLFGEWKPLHPMIIGRSKMKDHHGAKRTVEVSIGESVRILWELQ
jgi:hypothetical protein